MAISSTALTLPEYAAASNSPLIKKVVFSLREAGAVWVDIPFLTHPSMQAVGARITGNLPTIGWVKLNTAPADVKTTPTPFQEQAFILRNTISIDHLMVEDVNQIGSIRGLQANAYLKAVTYDFNDKVINNDHVTGNADALVGFRARLDDPATFGTLAANKIDAGAVDLRLVNATAASANTFLQWLDQLLYALDALDGTGVVIYMNNDLLIRIPYIMRLLPGGAGFSTAQDAYGRMVYKYRNATLKDVGLKADQSTKIITSTETTAGAATGGSSTSMYGVRYGEEYVQGWQFAPLMAKDLGLDPTDGVLFRTFFEWAGGLFIQNTRSLARLFNIKMS